MKFKKPMALLLTLFMLLPILPGQARADHALGFRVETTPQVAQIGKTVEAVISLTGYTADAADPIRGLQVDVTGVDTQILTVESYTSLISDNTAASNTASYNAGQKRVRLAYAHLSGTLAAPCTDVLKIVFRIRQELTEEGSITLPVTVKIQTVSQRITQTGELTIHYSPEPPEVISIDISWGAMDFVYDKGTWDPQTHRYDGGGWQDNGTGLITVKNAGNVVISADFAYETEREDISASFADGAVPVTGPVALAVGQEKQVQLILSGEPSGDLDQTEIGRVTIRIGGE